MAVQVSLSLENTLHSHSSLRQGLQSAALSLTALSTNPHMLPGPDVYVKIHPSHFCITHTGSLESWTRKHSDISNTNRFGQVPIFFFSSYAIMWGVFSELQYTKARWKYVFYHFKYGEIVVPYLE